MATISRKHATRRSRNKGVSIWKKVSYSDMLGDIGSNAFRRSVQYYAELLIEFPPIRIWGPQHRTAMKMHGLMILEAVGSPLYMVYNLYKHPTHTSTPGTGLQPVLDGAPRTLGHINVHRRVEAPTGMGGIYRPGVFARYQLLVVRPEHRRAGRERQVLHAKRGLGSSQNWGGGCPCRQNTGWRFV